MRSFNQWAALRFLLRCAVLLSVFFIFFNIIAFIFFAYFDDVYYMSSFSLAMVSALYLSRVGRVLIHFFKHAECGRVATLVVCLLYAFMIGFGCADFMVLSTRLIEAVLGIIFVRPSVFYVILTGMFLAIVDVSIRWTTRA